MPHTANDPHSARQATSASGKEVAAVALEKLRRDKQPTRRGLILCAAAMGEMLRLGWHKDQLDVLEITWWMIHDGNGELIAQGSGIETDAGPVDSPQTKPAAAAVQEEGE